MPTQKKWPPSSSHPHTVMQGWWVTFWAMKGAMKSGLYQTVEWQLEALRKQLERIRDDNEASGTRSETAERVGEDDS